jgi:hypothetical protein
LHGLLAAHVLWQSSRPHDFTSSCWKAELAWIRRKSFSITTVPKHLHHGFLQRFHPAGVAASLGVKLLHLQLCLHLCRLLLLLLLLEEERPCLPLLLLLKKEGLVAAPAPLRGNIRTKPFHVEARRCGARQSRRVVTVSPGSGRRSW